MARHVAAGALDAAFDYISTRVERLVVTDGGATAHAQLGDTVDELGDIAFGAADVTGPGAGDPDGREVTYAAKEGLNVDASGNANHLSLVRDTAAEEEVLVTTEISNAQAVTMGNSMNTAAFTHRIAAAGAPA